MVEIDTRFSCRKRETKHNAKIGRRTNWDSARAITLCYRVVCVLIAAGRHFLDTESRLRMKRMPLSIYLVSDIVAQ